MQEYLSSMAKCTKQERDFLKVRKYINVLNANQDSWVTAEHISICFAIFK